MLASSDVMAFPSETDTVGNAVLEGMACGLPVVVREGTAGAEVAISYGNSGAIVKGGGSPAWVRALSPLLSDPQLLARCRSAAQRNAALLPTWAEVLREDLLPVWQLLFHRSHRHGFKKNGSLSLHRLGGAERAAKDVKPHALPRGIAQKAE